MRADSERRSKARARVREMEEISGKLLKIWKMDPNKKLTEILSRCFGIDTPTLNDEWCLKLMEVTEENRKRVLPPRNTIRKPENHELVPLTCDWCGKDFERERYAAIRSARKREKYNSSGPFCSRSCGSKWAARSKGKHVYAERKL